MTRVRIGGKETHERRAPRNNGGPQQQAKEYQGWMSNHWKLGRGKEDSPLHFSGLPFHFDFKLPASRTVRQIFVLNRPVCSTSLWQLY